MVNGEKKVNAIMSSMHRFGSEGGIFSSRSYDELNRIVDEYSHELVVNKMDAPSPIFSTC